MILILERFIFMCLVVTTLSLANDIEDAKTLLQSQDNEEAFELFLKQANNGNSEAQYYIGNMLYNAIGVNKDRAAAVRWYEKAAIQNNTNAQVALGKIYYEGDGIFTLSNYPKAMELFQKASKLESLEADCMIGKMILAGDGVEKNVLNGVKLLKLTALKNNQCSQFELGLAYEQGNGVQKNYTLAMDWYLRSAKQGNMFALDRLGIMFTHKKGVVRNFAIAYALFNIAESYGYQYDEDDDDEDDEDDSKGFVYDEISNTELESYNIYIKNPDKLWKDIDEARRVSLTNQK